MKGEANGLGWRSRKAADSGGLEGRDSDLKCDAHTPGVFRVTARYGPKTSNCKVQLGNRKSTGKGYSTFRKGNKRLKY